MTGTGTGSGTAAGTTTGTATGGGVDGGLDVTPITLDFGAVVAHTAKTLTVTVTNDTGAEIDGITTSISGSNAAWFVITGLPSSLAAGAQATVSITFAPLEASASVSASVTFAATAFDSATLGLTGVALGTALNASPNPIHFGYVPLLSTVTECTTVSNVANVDVDITGITDFANPGNTFAPSPVGDTSSSNPYGFVPLTVPAGGSAQVCFALTPPITQQYQGQVTLVTTDPGGINPIVELSAWGGGPQISCTPTSLTFGVFDGGNIFPSLPVSCTNTGTALPGIDLVLGEVTTSLPDVYMAKFELDAGDLAPGQSVTIDVTYDVTSNPDGSTATLQINSNAGQGEPVQIPLAPFGE